MNKNISSLCAIAEKPSRKILGLMSGTSLDGLDVALCHITGSGLDTKLTVEKFTTINYTDDLKKEVKQIFSLKNIELEKLCLLNEWIGTQHATMINDCLKQWGIENSDIDIVASHGQTIYHAPKSLHAQEKFGNATLQIGDGDHIATATGIITISDFRQKHIAAGGEGAPLAAYGDLLLFSKKGEDRILLNIGGIANFTSLPGNRDINDIFSTDVGPGNTLMDAFVQQHFPGKYFDEDAALAKQGSVHEGLLAALKENSFLVLPFPRTTGPELFNLRYLEHAKKASSTQDISKEDTMSTLVKFTADVITDSIHKCFPAKKDIKIFVSGGGMHNPLLMYHLQEQLPGHHFATTKELGIDPDAKEAVLFAVLANECICGDASVFESSSKKMPAVSMGKISFPG